MADTPREDHAGELARIEAEIAEHRRLYLAETWAGHEAVAMFHETEVDRLLGEWQGVRAQS